MPHSAGLLRAPHACFGTRRPARIVPHRPRTAAAAPERSEVLLNIETHTDGSVVYHFGDEADAAALATAAAVAAAAGVAPPAVVDAAAASSSMPPAAHHQQHHHAASTSTSSSSIVSSSTSSSTSNGANVSNGLAANGNNAAALLPKQLTSTAEAAAQLEELLHLSSSDEEDGGHGSLRRRNGHRTPAAAVAAAAAAPSTSHSGSSLNGESHQLQQQHLQHQHQHHLQNGAAAVAAAALASTPTATEVQLPTLLTPSLSNGATTAAPGGLDYRAARAGKIVGVYDALCEAGQLDEALQLVKECLKEGRGDVLSRLKHYRFLRPATSRKAVKQALRFVQLLPRKYADARTYNMLLRACAVAGDLRAALGTADMLRMAGLKMDAILYTTLISACAAAGDAEKAFQLFNEMKADGVAPDRMVYASVVKACAEQIDRLPQSERRRQLVLLERAFGLVEEAKGARIPTDAAIWNALVNAAGNAGQLQRAFAALEDMVGNGTRPNDRTYACLIDACARAGDKALALRVYRKAQREGCVHSLQLYSAAVNACMLAREGADAATAMSIYTDLQRNRVAPDNQLYCMLMMAAGRSGNLGLVLDLNAEMLQEGLTPCAATESALLAVHIRAGKLADAQRIYRGLRARGEWPHAYALNALLNAHANAFRLGDVVSLVCEMAEGGLRPDAFTFAAIFNACQRADEAELALDVAKLMKRHGVRMDEAHAMLLLRICYNRLRQTWVPGGYPPHRHDAAGAAAPVNSAAVNGLPAGSRRSHERQRLLEALTPRGRPVELRESVEVAWTAQAFTIYREAVASGVKPSMRMLNRVLMCLRVAWEGKQSPAAGAAMGTPEALLMPHHHHQSPLHHAVAGSARVPRQEKIGVESVYHVQAMSIMEEAIISNVVPSFKLDSDKPIDLRAMPPAVAEVYVLTVLSAMQRQCEAQRVIKQHVVLLVPEYDGSKVFMPSHINPQLEKIGSASTSGAAARKRLGKSDVYDSEEEAEEMGFSDADFALASAGAGPAAANGVTAAVDARTGLGVAGVLRRLRLWAREYGERGFLLLEAKEITRWCKATQRAGERRSASALSVQKPYRQALQGQAGLQQQQRRIRLGL